MNPDYEEKTIFLYHYLIDIDNDNKNNKIDIYFDTGQNSKQKFNTTNCIKLVQNVWNINESQIKEIKKIIKEHQKNDDEYLKFSIKRNEVIKIFYSCKNELSNLKDSDIDIQINEFDKKIKELDKKIKLMKNKKN